MHAEANTIICFFNMHKRTSLASSLPRVKNDDQRKKILAFSFKFNPILKLQSH